MTPEERAQTLINGLGELAELPNISDDAMIELFASAIRQAENEALERAETRVQGIAMMEHEAGGPANDDLMGLCINQIRSLRHPAKGDTP